MPKSAKRAERSSRGAGMCPARKTGGGLSHLLSQKELLRCRSSFCDPLGARTQDPSMVHFTHLIAFRTTFICSPPCNYHHTATYNVTNCLFQNSLLTKLAIFLNNTIAYFTFVLCSVSLSPDPNEGIHYYGLNQ